MLNITAFRTADNTVPQHFLSAQRSATQRRRQLCFDPQNLTTTAAKSISSRPPHRGRRKPQGCAVSPPRTPERRQPNGWRSRTSIWPKPAPWKHTLYPVENPNRCGANQQRTAKSSGAPSQTGALVSSTGSLQSTTKPSRRLHAVRPHRATSTHHQPIRGTMLPRNSSGPGSRGWFATLSRRKPTFLQANGAHKNAFLTNKVARANKIRKYGLAA